MPTAAPPFGGFDASRTVSPVPWPNPGAAYSLGPSLMALAIGCFSMATPKSLPGAMRSARLLERCLADAGVRNAEALTRSAFAVACPLIHRMISGAQAWSKPRNSNRYFLAEGRFKLDPLCPQEVKAEAYGDYLRKARGFALDHSSAHRYGSRLLEPSPL